MKVPSNELRTIRNFYQNQLERIYGQAEASRLILILIKHYFGFDRSQLAVQSDLRLSESEMLKIHFAVKELLQHKPVQYITGETEFFGHTFHVKTGVLIPRPETEQLVDIIVRRFQNRSSLSIWDLGTGSGCIAISLALALSQAKVKAFDISNEAICLAKTNAEKLNADISLHQTDILAMNPAEEEKLDIVVSNPPYVRLSERAYMQKNVLNYEPEMALFVPDEDPFLFYRVIAKLANQTLARRGELWFEINEAFGKEIADICNNLGFGEVQIHQDFHGRDRFVSALKL
ncbi:MAG: peptide chain release factor N(5)-glutamine methyltransferase [Bacteroidales bacterium]|jgi:release factor glutamine methyltransferase|nr:peptide chain release factor N(5)-glutamine methyltransferase [Bacteroidales bacterium]HOI32107.1 peptide chain release factor N(5)-glutamine methyltransferase [Bacteroidales bacterium]